MGEMPREISLFKNAFHEITTVNHQHQHATKYIRVDLVSQPPLVPQDAARAALSEVEDSVCCGDTGKVSLANINALKVLLEQIK